MTRRRLSITSHNVTPTRRCASGANAVNVGGVSAWCRCHRRRACCTPDRCRSDRLAIQLNAEESRALENVAKRHHTSLSTLFLALFALAVGQGWNMTRFRLNVPLFHRERTGGRASPHRRFL